MTYTNVRDYDLTTGIPGDEVCNNFAIAEKPKNITCPLLFGSSCTLEEGDWVLWRVYHSGLDDGMLDLYYTSVTDVSKPHLEGFSDRNLYVSESLELVIKNVAIVLHSNISCMIVLNSSSASCLDRTLCGETFLNLSIVELRKLNYYCMECRLCS